MTTTRCGSGPSHAAFDATWDRIEQALNLGWHRAVLNDPLSDVIDDSKAVIRLEGGCQGCGMASVTLKQGVEVEIKNAVPEITEVLDVTDHAGGENPYYQPGQGQPMF